MTAVELQPVVINTSILSTVTNLEFLRKVCFISFGDTNKTKGTINLVYKNNYGELFSGKETNGDSNVTFNRLQSFFDYASNKATYVLEMGQVTGTEAEKIAEIKPTLDELPEVCYWYVLPKVANISDYNALVQSYVDYNSKRYFVIPLDESDFETFKGKKSVIGVYENLNGANLTGVIAGKFASSIFDIGSSRKASPMNYKRVDGVVPNELSISLKNKILGGNVSFVDYVGGYPVILGGRCMDGHAVDYWYQNDLVAQALEDGIKTLLLNGVNNPNYGISFNQNGIDTITAKITSILNTHISNGCLTEFGTTLNTSTNQIDNPGYIIAVDFNSFVSASPEKYENEIYDGFSFILRIGRYIRQIQLNVELI